jgi:dolichol-phosphate mannosyltransferase
MDLSVVIPVYNEADNVEPLLKEVVAALDGKMAYEVLFVDDASKDETVKSLEALKPAYPVLRVICHECNCGQSGAVLTGVRHARAGWIATLDGDGQNDPADIPAMIRARDEYTGDGNLKMVAGWRAKRNDTWIRRMSSRVANAVRSSMLKDKTPDTGCGLKVFERETFLYIPHFNHMHRFLPALFRRSGADIINVQVNHRPRTMGQSKYGVMNRLWVGIVDIFGVMWLRRRKCQVASREINHE